MESEPTAEAERARWSDLVKGQTFAHVILVMLGISLHAMDIFIVSTILPSVVADIGGEAYYAWPSAIYLVFSIMGAASAGVIGANQGLKRGPILAAAAYLVGSLICANAPDMPIFLVGRAFQGVGGGLLMALSYAMISLLFADKSRPHMFALVSVVWGAAALLGPTLGGSFAQNDFWRGVYWLTIPIFAALALLIWKGITHDYRQSTQLALPWRRLLYLGGSIFLIAFGSRFEDNWLRLGMICVAVLGMSFFLWRDSTADNKLFPTRPASLSHPVGVAYWIFFLLSVTYTPINIFMPLAAQKLHAIPPSLAGYVSAAMAFGWSVFAFISSGAKIRAQRILMVTGPFCFVGGIFGQSFFAVDGPIWALCVFVFMTGAGIGQCFSHITNRAMALSRKGEEAITSTGIPTMQSIGIAFGAAFAGILANSAGLSEGISFTTVEATMSTIYLYTIMPGILVLALALRIAWLTRSWEPN
jgi:MFS family permease